MKKTALALLLIVLNITIVSAANMQKIYQRDSTEYQSTYALCIASGVLPPSSVTPLTGSELMHALSRIPYENLNQNEKELYNKLISELEYHPVLEYDLFGMDPTPILALDIFTQTKALEREIDLIFPREDRIEAVNLAFDFKFADSGYGFVDWMMISPLSELYLPVYPYRIRGSPEGEICPKMQDDKHYIDRHKAPEPAIHIFFSRSLSTGGIRCMLIREYEKEPVYNDETGHKKQQDIDKLL